MIARFWRLIRTKTLCELLSASWSILHYFVTGNDRKLSAERMIVCRDCEYMYDKSNFCLLCDCYLPAKTAERKEKCPKGKW